ncbi:MAG: FtsQ-type POTRA domain-containing protein [Actinomycetaceae bacterium]|nr:FtsQ-type POTRA domain-containing protein [Actinomycetaceae bacterium]
MVKKTRISSPRRYFTPKRASETFGAKKDTIELGERRAEIKSARRMAILMRILIALGALAVVAAIVWAVFFSPFFALTASKIEVTGLNDDVPESAVQEKLTPYVGVPLPRISMGSAQESIEGIVQVKSARVSRAWPDGLSVNITVREPIAAEKTDEGYNVLDGEGVVIRSTLEYPEGLALVELNTEAEEDRETAMTRVAKVHEALPAELRERVAVYVGNALTVEMRTTDGRLIKWGDESDSGLKAQVVMLLLDQRPAQVYDVSTPARPVTS